MWILALLVPGLIDAILMLITGITGIFGIGTVA